MLWALALGSGSRFGLSLGLWLGLLVRALGSDSGFRLWARALGSDSGLGLWDRALARVWVWSGVRAGSGS